MSSIYRRLTLFTVLMGSLLFSSIVAAHPENPSVLQTVFGEHLSHWLIAHQGLVILVGLTATILLARYAVRRLNK